MTDDPYQVTERGDPRDRITNQQPLFDVKRLGPIVCSVCGATRNPDQQRAEACRVDRDRQAGTEHRRRPVGCLNAINNAETEIPY